MEWVSFAAAVIVAVLSLIGTLYGSRAGVKEANKLVNYRLDQLSQRVDKHNNVVERTYHLEQEISVAQEQIKVANHRISDLEEFEKNRGE